MAETKAVLIRCRLYETNHAIFFPRKTTCCRTGGLLSGSGWKRHVDGTDSEYPIKEFPSRGDTHFYYTMHSHYQFPNGKVQDERRNNGGHKWIVTPRLALWDIEGHGIQFSWAGGRYGAEETHFNAPESMPGCYSISHKYKTSTCTAPWHLFRDRGLYENGTEPNRTNR